MRRTFLLLCLPISFVVFAATANGCHFAGGLDDNDYGPGGAGPTSSNGSGGTGATGGSSGTGGMGMCTQECGACEVCATNNMCQPAPGQTCDEVDGGSCDSVGTCVAGDAQWVTVFGPGNDQRARGVAVSSTGQVLVAGDFGSAIEIGNSLSSLDPMDRDLFLGIVEADEGVGTSVLDWGDSDTQLMHDLAVDAEGNVLMAGEYSGALTPVSGDAINVDGYVIKLDSGLSLMWKAQVTGGGAVKRVNGVVADALQVIAVGDFDGTILSGLDDGDMLRDGFVVAYQSETMKGFPDINWSRDFSGVAGDSASVKAVAVDSAGAIIVVGDYAGTPTLDTAPEALPDGGVGGSMFVAKLSPVDGTVQWVKSFGTMAGRSTALSVAVHGLDIVVVGDYSGSIGLNEIADNANSFADVISLKLDTNGDKVWAAAHPSPGAAHAYSVAVDQAGNIVLGGKFESAVTCGGVEHLCQGSGFDAFVFKLASNGERIWSYTAGTKDDDDVIWDIVIDGDNSVLLAGEVSGDLVPPGLAGMANVPAFTGGTDVLLAKLAP